MIKYITKRFIITIIILLSFLAIYLVKDTFINPLLINAFYNDNNNIGSYPFEIDPNDYYNDNIYLNTGGYLCNISQNGFTFDYNDNNNITYSENNTVSFTSTKWWGYCSAPIKVEANTTYYFNFDYTNENIFYGTYKTNVYYENPIFIGNIKDNSFVLDEDSFIVFVWENTSDNETRQNISNILLSKSNSKTYTEPFKFGFTYGFTYSNNGSNSSNSRIKIEWLNENNEIMHDYTIRYYCSGYCEFNDNIGFIPFNIDNNGNISFNYKYNVTITNPGNVSLMDTGLSFNIKMIGTNKNTNTDIIKLKKNYVFNSYFLQGLSFGSNYNNSIIEGHNIGITTPENNTCQEPFSGYLKQGEIYNYISECTLSKPNISDNFVFKNLYNIKTSFGIKYQEGMSTNEYNNILTNTIYNIKFNSINLFITGSHSTTPPVNDSDQKYEIYETCSAWYDLPCQAKNAVTYITYHLPLISPLLQLLETIRTGVVSLVDLFKEFEGFGVIFSVATIGMIYCIIKKLYGSNE